MGSQASTIVQNQSGRQATAPQHNARDDDSPAQTTLTLRTTPVRLPPPICRDRDVMLKVVGPDGATQELNSSYFAETSQIRLGQNFQQTPTFVTISNDVKDVAKMIGINTDVSYRVVGAEKIHHPFEREEPTGFFGKAAEVFKFLMTTSIFSHSHPHSHHKP